MEGDLDEIDDKVGDTTTESMEQFEQQYMQILWIVQNNLCKMQKQTSRIHVGTGKLSVTQVSLALGTGQDAELERTMDL